jgi:peptidylprolyl isomerase
VRALALSFVLVAACGGSPAQSNPDLAMPVSPGACVPTGYTPVPFATTEPVRSFTQAEPSLEAGRDYVAALETDQGCVVLDLYEADTPTTVNSFVFLARHHYFDGVAFHRVIDGFMAQTGDPNSVDGDPSSWGRGDPGYFFGLEIVAGRAFDRAGVVGMARTSDPDSNGSQFFITLAPATFLDQEYTVFAGVLDGLDVLPRIVRGEPPSTPTRITSVRIASK